MSFKSKETLLDEINQLFGDLNQGNFDAEKMNSLVENTRELYERTVILRHQADVLLTTDQPVSYENDVFTAEEEADVVMEEVIIDELEDEVEGKVEETFEDEISIEEEPETPVMNETFSVEEKEDDFSFDLFGTENTPEETVENFVAQTEVEETIEDEVEEKIVHTLSNEATSTPIEPTPSFTQSAYTQPEITQQVEEETPVVAAVENMAPSQEAHAFFSGYESIKTNPNAMMVSPRIDQLATCFSLNEKLGYIRELFNGSSNDFNQVINSIDQSSSFEEAKTLIQPIAIENRWNLDTQITTDFINKVERRFF